MTAGPVVDTPSALEFQREIKERISEPELHAIVGDLERKSAALGELLSAGPGPPDPAAMREVLGWVFATRRRAEQILGPIGPDTLAAAVGSLLSGGEPVAHRIDRFEAALGDQGSGLMTAGIGFELASELLHFTAPDRYWLWTRWIWDPEVRTGALALVTTDDVDLNAGATTGARYLSVGRAMAFVDETGKAAGFTAAGSGTYGLDVLLASVYGIYMYTVLRLRLTREFNRVVPPLADLVRRLLGVYRPEA